LAAPNHKGAMLASDARKLTLNIGSWREDARNESDNAQNLIVVVSRYMPTMLL